MSRATRSNLPVTQNQLIPEVQPNVDKELTQLRSKQKFYADRNSRPAKSIESGDRVQLQVGHRDWCSGKVIKKPVDQPRSVIVQTDDGRIFRRNRSHVRKSASNADRNDQLPITNHSPAESSYSVPESLDSPQNPLASTTAVPEQTPVTIPATAPGPQPVVTRYGRVIRPVLKL